MEGYPDSPVKSSSPSSQDPDSAVGTMSDVTPEDEEVPSEDNTTLTDEHLHSGIKRKLKVMLTDSGIKSSEPTEYAKEVKGTIGKEETNEESHESLTNITERIKVDNERKKCKKEKLELYEPPLSVFTDDKNEHKDNTAELQPLVSDESFTASEDVSQDEDMVDEPCQDEDRAEELPQKESTEESSQEDGTEGFPQEDRAEESPQEDSTEELSQEGEDSVEESSQDDDEVEAGETSEENINIETGEISHEGKEQSQIEDVAEGKTSQSDTEVRKPSQVNETEIPSLQDIKVQEPPQKDNEAGEAPQRSDVEVGEPCQQDDIKAGKPFQAEDIEAVNTCEGSDVEVGEPFQKDNIKAGEPSQDNVESREPLQDEDFEPRKTTQGKDVEIQFSQRKNLEIEEPSQGEDVKAEKLYKDENAEVKEQSQNDVESGIPSQDEDIEIRERSEGSGNLMTKPGEDIVQEDGSGSKLNEECDVYKSGSSLSPDVSEKGSVSKMYVYAYSSDSDSDKSEEENPTARKSDLLFKSEDYLNPVSSSTSLVDEAEMSTTKSILSKNDAKLMDQISCSDSEKEDGSPVDASLRIKKSGVVEEYINTSKVLNPFQRSKDLHKKESNKTIDQRPVFHSPSKKEGNDVHVENTSSSEKSSVTELNECLDDSKSSLSPVAKKTSPLLAATIEDLISGTDSEEEVSDSGEDEEMVVSASMQFTLAPHEGTAKPPEQEDVPVLSSSPGVSIHVKHHEEHVTHGNAEPPNPQEPSSNGVIKDSALDGPSPKEEPEPGYDLPDTVTRLTTNEGSEVFLVGTAHFSKESQDDVAKTIRQVHPDIVMVELCKSRTAVLQLDEETILNESQSLDFNKMCVIFRQHGKVEGILYLLLLSVSAHITKQLGMAPGGEFRTAFAEAHRSAPGCLIQFGDRPIQITLSRALASLSVWQKLKLLWHIMATKEPISKEEIEKCKQRDFIEEMLADMTGQFPAISEVFVKERDIYLTKSLQDAAEAIPSSKSPLGLAPRVVVGVVGIGHVPGIVDHWGKITDDDIPPIMRIPPPNLSDQVCKFTLKITLYGVIGFGIYKCVPSSTKSSIFSAIENGFKAASNYFVK